MFSSMNTLNAGFEWERGLTPAMILIIILFSKISGSFICVAPRHDWNNTDMDK